MTLRLVDAMVAYDKWYLADSVPARLVTRPKAFQIPPIRVTADAVGAYYWNIEADEIDLARECGPLRMPYPVMWIEWRSPRRRYADGGWVDVGESQTDGAVLIDGKDHIDAHPFSWLRGRGPIMWPVAVRWKVRDGAPESYVAAYGGLTAQRAEGSAMEGTRPALMAIGFMNCRNVEIRTVIPPEKLSRRHQRRYGHPLVRYSTVVLPGPKRDGRHSVVANGGVAALHLVRGHFKTYTADAPLFGSHVGTYWWSWQARGSARNGTVVPSYVVGTDSKTAAA